MTCVSAVLFFENNIAGEAGAWCWSQMGANVRKELVYRELAAELEAQIMPESISSHVS